MLSYKYHGYGMGMMHVHNDAPLSVMSFGIQQLFAWGMGCGVHRFEFEVKKADWSQETLLIMTPLNPVKSLEFANCSMLDDMLKQGLMPIDIPVPERMNIDGNQAVVFDGQSRFTFKEGEGMLLQTYDTRPDISMATWAFGNSDNLTGFIYHGVRKAKLFFSQKLTQLHLAPEVPRGIVAQMMSSAGVCYPVNETVGQIKSIR